jgi:phosphoheptose isomerase
MISGTSMHTAIFNDYGYNALFARKVPIHAQRGGLMACLSSGKSLYIIAAIEKVGLVCFSMNDNVRGSMTDLCAYFLDVPSVATLKIEDKHAVISYILSGLVKRVLFKAHA